MPHTAGQDVQQRSSLLNDSAHWLQRAQQTRAMAESITDTEAKLVMLGIADSYEELARRAELRRK
jgi:hypothetical protein